MRARIKDLSDFERFVFGADSFLEYFPELLNEDGIEIIKRGDFYYIAQNSKIVNDSCFFSEEELQYLEISS